MLYGRLLATADELDHQLQEHRGRIEMIESTMTKAAQRPLKCGYLLSQRQDKDRHIHLRLYNGIPERCLLRRGRQDQVNVYDNKT